MKNIILIAVAILILVGGGVYMLMSEDSQLVENESTTPTAPTSATPEAQPEQATTTPEESASDEPTSVLGTSAGGEVITAYHFGTGETELLFIGGIHGGYSWNTSLLAFELIDWLEENEDKVPENVKVTIIPVLNPDGLKVVTGTTGLFKASAVNTAETVRITGRFNANEVDINRNFDCEWESVGTWQNRSVSGGDTPFSEPESAAVRAYVEA
ncbi:MAG: Peptidase M14 carboxypeptidase A, partial [Parcubacteria group bacterium GW2011_GWF2_44_8]